MMDTVTSNDSQLAFVCGANDVSVLQRFLLASPCFASDRRPLQVFFNVGSAAEAFNAAMATTAPGTWLIWVHQDVLLPQAWDAQFLRGLSQARRQFPKLAVAGVYGLRGRGAKAQRAGHVLDRGHLLRESVPLPCAADSLDELLFAVQAGNGLRLDPELGFDLYATDVVLQAQARGLHCAVLDAYCEHWSSTPTGLVIPASMARRIRTNGAVFEAKWASQLPVSTSWVTIERPGDVGHFIDQFELR